MSCFDDEEVSAPKVKGPSRRRKKQTPAESEGKPVLKFNFPPLMIKQLASTFAEEEFEHPLQDFVDRIYSDLVSTKPHNQIVQSFLKEDDEGNIQYKLKLVNPTEDRLDHLATQMKYRINQGAGEAYYRIGVEDNGRPVGLPKSEMLSSLKTICYLATKIHTDVLVLRVSEGLKGLIVELKIQKIQRQGVKLEIRVLLFGDSGSGKSTLLGVLKSGEKDDGKGNARMKVFTHKHELMTGATQTKSHHVIGFDSEGHLYNQQRMMSLEKWFDNANKLLTFIDIGGHKKAEKQLVSSLCSFFPEYALWVVSGKCSLEGNELSANNLELAAIFNLPLIVVITHLDKMDSAQELESIYCTKQALKKLYPDKTPCVIKEMQYAVLFSRITSTQDVIPIFLLSSVTGRNFDLFTNFLNLLTSVSELKNNEEMHTQFSISDKYVVDGNIILAGTVIKGIIKKGQIVQLGPDLKSSFRAVEIVSIECLRVPVKLAKCGQICTIAIKLLNYSKQWLDKQPNAIRRGMVLVDSKCNPQAVYEFSAEFTPYSSEKEIIRITEKYQPVVNTLTARQICSIVLVKEEKQVLQLELARKKSKSIDNLKFKTEKQLKKTLRKESVNISSFQRKKQSVDLSHQVEFVKHPFSDQPKKKQQMREACEFPQPEQVKIQETEKPSKTSMTMKLLEPINESISKKKREVEEILFREGETTTVRLRFKYQPQYMTVGQKLVINELKLIGKVKEIHY